MYNLNLDTSDKLRVLMIGAGGNGSELMDGLIRLDQALKALGAAGLMVYVMDDDEVSSHNTVRQRFYPHEIGLNKAVALVHRGNITFGLNWSAIPERLTPENAGKMRWSRFDFIITATDNVAARLTMHKAALSCDSRALWLDLGVDRAQGQFVIGRIDHNKLTDDLPNVTAHYPNMEEAAKSSVSRPSCSAADSLARQDLMVNQAVSMAAINMLWQALRRNQLAYNGGIVDLTTCFMQPIPLPQQKHH